MHWHDLFIPSGGWGEIGDTIVRGSFMFWAIFWLLRVLRREVGGVSTIDVLVIVVIADAAQNGMAGSYTSITTGFVLVSMIAFWAWASDYAAWRWVWWRRIAEPKPLRLIKDGQLDERALRRVQLTREELDSGLRKAGCAHIEQVHCAYLEPDGHISACAHRT